MKCYYCNEDIFDMRTISGSKEVSYATKKGDFGCDFHPISNEEGVGSHSLREMKEERKR